MMTSSKEQLVPVEQLQPCPFCGSEASGAGSVRYSTPLNDTWWEDGSAITEAFYVNCMRCFASTRSAFAGGQRTREKAIVAWNRRTPPAVEPACTCLTELEDDAYGPGGPMSGKQKPPPCILHRAAVEPDEGLVWLAGYEWHKPAHRAVMASVRLGKWMSAALDDPSVCEEMKSDIREWFSAGEPLETIGAALATLSPSIRAQALEEAAKVAEDHMTEHDHTVASVATRLTARNISDAIRALKGGQGV